MSSKFDQALHWVKQLVADFKANETFYLSAEYQEQEARRDFIDKFWIALGWDVNHDTQKNPYEQEVKVERKELGTSQRRADYAFYLRPDFREVKFYVEAKKPFGDIATADNYFQIVRYGWSSQTPVAILHDFEQFQIVDCRYKPNLENALNQNINKYHYSEYLNPEKFAEIYWLFSHEAVAGGSLEKYASALPKRRGKAVQRGLFKGGDLPIGDAFLAELDDDRLTLARCFKNKNPSLDGETLTELTQRTLDRLVFLRFLEDKHIEPQNRIAYFGDKGSAWQDFIAESRRLDGIYNGVVYKEHRLLDSPKFKVDDEAFSNICEQLCHLNSPYDFNAIPIHILGSIYERFLGKVIVTTEKRAEVDEKPEVRKAGGVYYTPEYIVHYIVENTVGNLIEGKTPAQIAEMRFADIACGSGSFLLGVYDCLLRYHTKFYNENPDKAKIGGKGAKAYTADCEERDDGLHLTLQKKREILLNNVYGVDIDAQAVEVAQLSLYLKLLQDETPASAHQYFLDFEQQAILPSLSKNIVCGNSLIGTDILDGQLFASDEERKLNPMNFEDAFPQIFRRRPRADVLREMPPSVFDYTMPNVPLHGGYAKGRSYKSAKSKGGMPVITSEVRLEGGFDAIVGNPPYLKIEHIDEAQREYFSEKFRSFIKRLDVYGLFVERAFSLLKQNGDCGYIIPSTILNNASFTELRKLLLEKATIKRIVNLGGKVFAKVNNDTLVLLLANSHGRNKTEIFDVLKYGDKLATASQTGAIDLKKSTKRPDYEFELRVTEEMSSVFAKLYSSGIRLGDRCESFQGLVTGSNEAYIVEPEVVRKDGLEKEICRPVVFGDEVARYAVPTPAFRVIYLTRESSLEVFPNVKRRLLPYKSLLGKKREVLLRRQPWYALHWPRSAKKFEHAPKILVQAIRNLSLKRRLVCALDTDGLFADHTLNVLMLKPGISLDIRFFLGILNSSLVNFLFLKKHIDINIKGIYLEAIPIPDVKIKLDTDYRYKKIILLVEQMLAAKKELTSARTDKDKAYYENKCASLDRQIDTLVYGLYGLSEIEISIVESGLQD